MISLQVLGEDHQVVTALVGLSLLIKQPAAGHIHLTSDDGLEQFLLGRFQLLLAGSQFRFGIFRIRLAAFEGGNLLLQILYFTVYAPVFLVDVIEKFLDTEHIAMVGNGNSLHSIGHRLVDQTRYRSLTVQNGILGMNVQMNKILHR